MNGLERPIYFTSCAVSICKWEKEEKEKKREVILHLLHRKSVYGPSKVASINTRKQKYPSWPEKSALDGK